MTWFVQDDSFSSHPKVLSIPRAKRFAAIGLWDMAGTWCARHLTDGHVPTFMLDEWGTGGKGLAQLLVTAGLWENTDGGYLFHDWDDWQTSKDDVVAKRKAHARKQSLVRNGDVRDAVQRRDRDRCRYCGVQVAWTDRRGGRGGTYHFLDADGPTTCENVVIVCRGCAALLDGDNHGLTLRPAPTTQVGPDQENQDVSGYDPDQNQVVSNPQPLPNPTQALPSNRTTPPGGRKAPARPDGLDLDLPAPPPSQAALNASHVVAAWVQAMNANGVKPTTAQTGRVGRMARELLTAENTPEDVLAAATEAGRAGFEAIDRELAKAKGRPRLTTVPADARPVPGSRLWDQATNHHTPRESA